MCPGASDRHVQQLLVEVAEKHNLHQVHNSTSRRADNRMELVFTTTPTFLKASVDALGSSDHDLVVSDFCIRLYQAQ